MAAATKTFHGTRAILSANLSDGSTSDTQSQLGIFESIETGVTQDHFEPFILGRASAGEVAVMGQAPIMVRLSGFRKIEGENLQYGPYGNKNLAMNKLQEILADNKELMIQVFDRQSGQVVARVLNCKVVSHNFSVAAKQPARLSLELVGLVFEDETGSQSEAGVAW
jgi:hypothetical protein